MKLDYYYKIVALLNEVESFEDIGFSLVKKSLLFIKKKFIMDDFLLYVGIEIKVIICKRKIIRLVFRNLHKGRSYKLSKYFNAIY